MKRLAIPGALRKNISMAGLKLKKYSPEILLVGGIIGIVGTVVLACRATTKISGILDETAETSEEINNALATGVVRRDSNPEKEEKYTEEDAKQELTALYVHTAVNFAKLYAPAALLGAASISGIVLSHNIMSKRNQAISATLAAVTASYNGYRKRVADRFGEETERELQYGIKSQKFEETVTDENGKEKKSKNTVKVADPNVENPYRIWFDDMTRHYEDNHDYKMMFLKQAQNHANDKLRAQGYLFLGDVYDMLDIDRTKISQCVGWVYRPDDDSRDNYVDFSIQELNRAVGDTYEPAISLEFNVDGNILDLI